MIKFIVEVLLAIFLHPIAFILCVIDIVPILYVLLGGGKFW